MATNCIPFEQLTVALQLPHLITHLKIIQILEIENPKENSGSIKYKE